MDKSGPSVAHRESADVGHRLEGGFDNEMREKSNQSSTESHRVDPCDPNDPNDPMNWPSWAKYMTYGTICFYTFLATANASNLSVAIVPVSEYFHISSGKVTYLLCFNTMMLGVGNLFWVPLARVIGRRPIYLISMALLMAFNVWSYKSKSYGSLLAARMLSGFAAASGDAPVTAVVADLFRVTERGYVMMFFQLALSCGFFLGPVINAYITQYAGGWQWTCGWIAVAAGANCVVAIFTLWETSYPARYRNDGSSNTVLPVRRSFMEQLSVTHGFNRNGQFFQSLWDILILAVFPPVTWGGVMVGIFVGWNMVVQFESAILFVQPPYLWKTHSIGLLALSGFIGTVLAAFIGGKMIDIIANFMTAKNNGHRVPEYRLVALFIPAIVGPVGLLIFGFCAAAKDPWIAPAVGYCMQGFGLTACSNIIATYAVDSCPGVAGEALVFFFAIRAVIACLLSLFGLDWIAATGVKNAFGEMVGIQYAFLLMGFIFYFRGPSIRKWTERFGPKSRNLIHGAGANITH